MKYRTFNCLEAVPSNQATIYISIHQVRAKGPDADGNFRVTIFYEVGVGEHQLLMRGQLLNSMGLILQEVHQEEAGLLFCESDVSEHAQQILIFTSVPGQLLGNDPENAQVIVSCVDARWLGGVHVGSATPSARPFEPIALQHDEEFDEISVISASLWRGEAMDNMTPIDCQTVLQNTTPNAIHVNITMSGEETDFQVTSESIAIAPGEIRTVVVAMNVETQTANDLLIDVRAVCTHPAAWGAKQHTGMVLHGQSSHRIENIHSGIVALQPLLDFAKTVSLHEAFVKNGSAEERYRALARELVDSIPDSFGFYRWVGALGAVDSSWRCDPNGSLPVNRNTLRNNILEEMYESQAFAWMQQRSHFAVRNAIRETRNREWGEMELLTAYGYSRMCCHAIVWVTCPPMSPEQQHMTKKSLNAGFPVYGHLSSDETSIFSDVIWSLLDNIDERMSQVLPR